MKGDCLIEERDATVPLSDADEAVCAYFIENPTALRRVVNMMPHGNPPLDFLQKLWSYAVLRNRKVDLANALLSYDKRSDAPQITFGREWYCECRLPCECPEVFWQIQKFGWVRDDLDLSDYEDFDEVESLLGWMEDVKELVGDGIVDMESTLRRIRLKRNGILRTEQEQEKRAKAAKEGSATPLENR